MFFIEAVRNFVRRKLRIVAVLLNPPGGGKLTPNPVIITTPIASTLAATGRLVSITRVLERV